MREDAAEMRRRPQRAADVRAELQRHEASGERRRRTARRAARGAAEIPRIVGGAVDLVVALPIAEIDRHIGLAEDDRAGRLQPLHRERIGVRPPILEFRMPPGGRQAGDVELLLDGHRQPEQRAPLAARKRGVGGIGGSARPVEIAHDDRVDLWIERLDAGDRGCRPARARRSCRSASICINSPAGAVRRFLRVRVRESLYPETRLRQKPSLRP